MRGRDDARTFVGKQFASASLSPGNRIGSGSQEITHQRHGSYCALGHVTSTMGPIEGWVAKPKEPLDTGRTAPMSNAPEPDRSAGELGANWLASGPPILARNAPKAPPAPHDAETETVVITHLR